MNCVRRGDFGLVEREMKSTLTHIIYTIISNKLLIPLFNLQEQCVIF